MDAGGEIYPYREAWHAHVGAMLLLLILLALLASAAAWFAYATARQRDQTRRAEARHAIYEDVRRAVDRALKAQGADLINAAQKLVDTVRLRLGPLPDFSKSPAGSTDAITKALAGKITDPPKPPAPPAPAPVPVKEGVTTGIITPPSLTGTVNVIEPPPPEKPPEKPPAPPAKPEERDMSLREQLQQLRLAVEAFAGAWEKNKVDAMLSAAQTALLDVRLSHSPEKH